jgi:glyoxylase-like metal-dependent hydrolase (beta-lactamase superfamily II)
MEIIILPVGPLQTNCCIVFDRETKDAVIIDPGDDAEKIIEAVKKEKLNPFGILLTHDHFDHIGAMRDVSDYFKIGLLEAKENEEIPIGGGKLAVILTPGHTPDGVCFIAEKEKFIISGDTLFFRSIGRTDLPGGNYVKIMESLRTLMKYPGEYRVYPGHGPATTIGEEREENPFL